MDKKISEETISFGKIEIEKRKFNHHENVILFGDVETEYILMYSMISCS